MEANNELRPPPDLNQKIEDTIPVPLENGEYLHASTSRRQFGDFFKEYADLLGFNGDEARQFFDDNVDLTFSPIDHRDLDLPLKNIERKFWIQASRIKHPMPQLMGETARLINGRYVVSIDPRKIAHGITLTNWDGKLEKYSDLSKEAKIATLKDFFIFVAMHELRHVLQGITEPEKWKAFNRKKVAVSRVILGLTASLPLALTSEMAALGWVGTSFGLMGFHSAVNPAPDLEKDPIDAVRKTDLEKLKLRPFTFDVESDSKPQT